MFDIEISDLVDRFKIPLLLILSICAVIAGILFFLKKPSVNEPRFLSEEEIARIKGVQDQKIYSEKWFVDIEGQVKSPGVIEVEPGITLLTAIEKAGGFTDKADLYYVQKEINLAKAVEDRQKVYVPAIGESAVSGQQSAVNSSTSFRTNESADASSLVNINTASVDELDTLSGIGPATAEKIIDARPFSSIEDIKRVSGIGDATFEKIKDRITI